MIVGDSQDSSMLEAEEFAKFLSRGSPEVAFFVIGPNVVVHPEIARGLLAERHEIGKHS